MAFYHFQKPVSYSQFSGMIKQLFSKENKHFCKNYAIDISLLDNSADVTLVSDEQVLFQAHKCVLGGASPVLKDILINNPCPHPLIYLRDVGQRELGALLQFLYQGQVKLNLEANHVNNLIKLATDLQIDQIIDSFTEEDQSDGKNDHENMDYNTTNGKAKEDYGHAKHNMKDIEKEADCKDIDNDEDTSTIINSSSFIDQQQLISPCETLEEFNDVFLKENIEVDEICGDSLDNVLQIETKLKDIKDKLHKCKDCGIGFKVMGRLVRHIKSVHGDVKYQCQRCPYKTSRPDHLQTHNRTIHEGFRYKCNLCNYEASKQYNIERHKKWKHEGERYFCNQCNFQTAHKDGVYKHTKSQHSYFLLFCEMCEFCTKRKETLDRHRKSKHEGKEYSCDNCEYRSSLPSNLVRHKKDVHEEPQFLCNQCGYITSDRNRLEMHQQSMHNGEKYSCDICKYEAKWERDVRRHRKFKHPVLEKNK